jgi:hypothetical protein
MDPDVTITISTRGTGSTGGTGSIGARGPSPSVEPEGAGGSGGPARGPVPLPLDELPGGAGAQEAESAGPGGRPVPGGGEHGAGNVVSPPMPMDLGALNAAPAGLPSPEDIEAMAAAAPGQRATRRRTRKSTGG